MAGIDLGANWADGVWDGGVWDEDVWAPEGTPPVGPASGATARSTASAWVGIGLAITLWIGGFWYGGA